MAEGVCKLTGESGKMAKAHLYPRSFYRLPKDAALALVSSETAERPRRSRIGVYDPELVTQDTEAFFATLDDHAFKILGGKLVESRFVRWGGKIHYGEDGLPLAYWIEGFDPKLLRLFFMSVLWRFGASGRPEAQGVDLGPYLDRIAQHLRDREPPLDHNFAVVGSRFIDEQNTIVSTPRAFRLGERWTWHMAFGAYEFFLKTDRRPFQEPWRSMALSERDRFPVIVRKMRGSKQWLTLAKMVQKKHEAFGDPWNGRFGFA